LEDKKAKITIFHRLIGWWLVLSILLLLVVGYATLGFVFSVQPGWLGQFSALQPLGIVVLSAVSGIGLLIIIAAFWAERVRKGTKGDEETAHRMSTRAEKIAANIRMKAQREAEAQAATIIAEAKRKAQEIATEAKRRAEAATRREVDDILEAAKRRAESVEERARQQAMAFLLQAREQMVDEVTTVNDIWVQEVKGVYYRLFSSLQDLIGEMERVESGWKSRSTELLRGRGLELKGLEATSSLSTEATELLTEPPATTQGEEKVQISGEEVVEHRARPSLRRRLFNLRKRIKPSKAPAEVEEKPHISGKEAIEQPVQPQGEIEAPISEEEAVQPESIGATAEETLTQKASEEPVKAERESVRQEYSALSYIGEVELILVPPVDLTKVSELYERLKAIPEVKIVRTVGSWDRGTTVTVALDKPLPLINILAEMPGFEARPAQSEKGSLLKGTTGLVGEKGGATRRVEITTRKG
jgi:vacuolar-type H+-ATPase subunit E/Vma4